MDVSVIIVNYNTRQMTQACIDSVFEKTEGIEFEVIVVDNASKDGSREHFSNFNKIKYIYLNENIGFGQANNAAYAVAKGRYILFLNSDTLLINNAIKSLSVFLDEHKDAGACGGNLYDNTLKPTLSFERNRLSIYTVLDKILRYLPSKLRYGRNIFHNYSEKDIKVGYISGADLMIRREIFEGVNGFSPQFFMYYEEQELQERINKCKFNIYSTPDAKIIHLEGGSTNKDVSFNEKKFTWQATSERAFIGMHRSRLDAFIIILLEEVFRIEKFFIAFIRNDKKEMSKCMSEIRIIKQVNNSHKNNGNVKL